MLELRLAGIHDDGENLVLESANGTSYLLPIDQNLRQSIAKARRISPLRTGGSGTFGPRDIQTRFRQGATVEEIAAESGWESERVRRYEWPIVAERANIIQTARRVVISPAPGNKGAAQSLDQHIETVAHRHHFVDAPMDWSTWQQESGQWTVSVDIELTEEATQGLPRGVMFPARWNFNPANQSIYASNEAAYFLMGRDNSKDSPIPAAATPEPAEEPAGSGVAAEEPAQEEPAAPRLTAVRVPENKEQNELLDELTARRGARSFDPASERKLADLLERARRSSRPAPAEAEGDAAESAEAESLGTQSAEADVESAEVDAPQADASSEQAPASGESNQTEQVETAVQPVEGSESADSQAEPAETAAETYVADQEEAAEAETTAPVIAATGDSPEVEPPAADEEETQGAEPEATTSVTEAEETAVAPEETEVTETRAAARTNRGKRTSVPSWDDIIFGNQRR